ncbi:MAG: DNA gyrase subunit A [Christensenellales bacterium]|jgi:DNA gyrase subunit A
MSKTGSKAPTDQKILHTSMEDAMHQSMMPYAEYVIMERALPRVEDGLKPVQRRILYAMMELGTTPDKPHKKSARIVGDTLGKYHPHGDTSIYDAMVRMAQPFNMRHPLIDGHGNFGSIDGDSAAAMRYTEARMAPLALELLRDIDKETVSFRLNFDDSLKEPDMLPGRFPNLLVNGASGIAVGLATNIPPHNLKETIDGVIAYIDKPAITLPEMLRHIKGPDFPTGGYIVGREELQQAYETGRGKIVIRAKTQIEKANNGKSAIVINELPYQVNKANCLEKILKLSEDKKEIFSGIADIRDESDRDGMRAVIEVRKDHDPELIRSLLFKYSDLQVTFGINMVAIAAGSPKQMGLIPIIRYYVDYQKQIIRKRTQFELENAQKRAHILEGLIIAVDHIDQVIRLIRSSSNVPEAKKRLMDAFFLTAVQAQAILDLRLQRLTNLEIVTLKKEYDELLKKIEELKEILKNESKLAMVIKKELSEIKKKYADARRTEFLDAEENIEIKPQTITAVEDVVVLLNENGYVKRISVKNFQRTAKETEPEDALEARHMLQTNTLRRIQLFTNKGNVFFMDVKNIPECRMKDRGTALNSLLAGFEPGEHVVKVFSFDTHDGALNFYTQKGMIKRSDLKEYDSKRAKLVACGINEEDEVLNVELVDENCTVLFVTKKGYSIHIKNDIPARGRSARGVMAIKLGEDDEVVAAMQVSLEGELIVMTDRGYAKRSFIFDYDIQGRNGKGLKTFDFKKNGSNGYEIIAALYVKEPYEMVYLHKNGEKGRLLTEEIPIENRFSKGQLIVMILLDNTLIYTGKTVLL